MEKLSHANRHQKKAEIATVILDKIDFKSRTARDNEGHYIMKKGVNA